MSFFLRGVSSCKCNRKYKHILHLHDLSETTLADYFEEFKIVNRETVLPVLDKVDADLHLAATELHWYPVGTGLASSTFSISGFTVLPRLLESGVDLECSNEDVFVATRVRRGGGVSDVKRYGEVGDTGHIELVLGVAARPEWVLGGAGDCIDEDLLLVEIDQSIGQVF